jgi:tetratricopeptide (TPR) repeat protein
LAERAVAQSKAARNSTLLAGAHRAVGNARHVLGDNRAALRSHAASLRLFESVRAESEIGRTENARIQPFILLGKYDHAQRAARRARRIFVKRRDKLRVAYVDLNLGNLYHRQDRFATALRCYERAFARFTTLHDAEGLAVAFSNMTSCFVGLNDFNHAVAVCDRARKLCVRQNLPVLLTQANYNRAYLFYLRGDYGRAIELLRTVRDQAGQKGDKHICALCDLVLTEIYLELNLDREAIETTRQAAALFSELHMTYESGKALANEAIALGRQGQLADALLLFARAHSVFVREHNLAWPSLIDLYSSTVLLKQGRVDEARMQCAHAILPLERSGQVGKAVLCRLLLTRCELQANRLSDASLHVDKALAMLANQQLPALSFEAHFLRGQILIGLDQRQDAFKSLQHARLAIESLRATLHRDELKTAFLKDKVRVYEQLVQLCMADPSRQAREAEVFALMELAKSRGLMELVFTAARNARRPRKPNSVMNQLQDLRAQIHWYYERIELARQEPSQSAAGTLPRLQTEVRDLENKFLRRFRGETQASATVSVHSLASTWSLRSVQSRLQESETLLEYFIAGDDIIATVIDRGGARTRQVSSVSRVQRYVHALHLQLAKFKLGPDYVKEFEQLLLEATDSHLSELHKELIEPVAAWLQKEQLVVVPHGLLHTVPFHALRNAEGYMVDRHTISYAPSASIYMHTSGRRGAKSRANLLLGIPDQVAPVIRDEIEAVSAILANSSAHLGEQASEDVLRKRGPGCRVVHIATHGNFRQDNPMFSTIKLGTSYLNLCDLYEMHLPVDLLTLSGCATGLSSIGAGDEHVGLMRGFLGAGARSLLLTLWDVNDGTTSKFMTSFYQAFQNGAPKAGAHRAATLSVRQSHKHPYYWAPYVLVGNPF